MSICCSSSVLIRPITIIIVMFKTIFFVWNSKSESTIIIFSLKIHVR